MLKVLRAHRTGLFGAVVVGLVCFTMVGFGINFFAPQGPNQAAITVNDREVSFMEYQNRLESYRSMLQQRLGENFAQFSNMINIEQQTVDQIIDGTLLEQFTGEMGVVPSTNLVRERIAQLPFFNGVVTEQRLRSFLMAAGMSGPELEATTRQEIALSLLRNSFQDLNSPTEAEMLNAYRFANKKMAFHVLTFSPEAFTASVQAPSEEQLQEYFEENQENYQQPAKVQYSTALFRAADYATSVTVSEEDIAETYERIKGNFVEPARVSFRRIVFKKDTSDSSNPVDELVTGEKAESESSAMSELTFNQKQRLQAEAALKRIEEGADFASVAQEVSEDQDTKAAGGAVGWTEFSLLSDPLRSTLFDLEVGAASSIVETGDAFYLLLVDGKQERREKPLEEVRDEVLKRVQLDYAPEYARAAAEEFLAQLSEDTTKAAEAFQKLTAEKSIPVAETAQPLQAGQTTGSVPSAVTDTALQLSNGDVELVEVETDSFVVLVRDLAAPTNPELSEVRSQVVAEYTKVQAEKLAREAAEATHRTLSAEGSTLPENLQAYAATVQAKLETTAPATASTPNHPLFRNPTVQQAAFQLNEQQPVLPKVESLGNATSVVLFASEQIPTEAEYAAAKDSLLQQQRSTAGDRLLTTLQLILRAEAEIWVEPTLMNEQDEVVL